jgi:CRISP-associated protein Cas1
MDKRVLFISRAAHLSVRNRQLALALKDTGEELTFPPNETMLVEIDNGQVTVTVAALQLLMAHNVAVMVADAQHLPTGMLVPLYHHTLHQKHLTAQIDCTDAHRAKLWKATIVAKINNQAQVLAERLQPNERLLYLAKHVKSGDEENAEAQAAVAYWKLLFADGHPSFRRDPDGDGLNSLLNYGYAIVRAIAARALVGAGLSPGLGLFHRNQYNPFPLADDVMEPYRPVVDQLVAQLADEWEREHPEVPIALSKELKQRLLTLPTAEVLIRGEQRTLTTAMQQTCVSLCHCYLEKETTVVYPKLLTRAKERKAF